MRPICKTLIATAVCTTALAGCFHDSNDSSGSSFSAYQRVDPLVAQTATISIAKPASANPVVTITQPNDITLAGSAVSLSGTQTRLRLTMTNNANRLLFGNKIVVQNISNRNGGVASTTAATGTTSGGKTYATFGLNALAEGESDDLDDNITLTDADGLDDPVVLQVTIPTTHRLAFGSNGSTDFDEYNIEDIGVGLEDNTTAVFTHLNAGDGGSVLDSVISHDGRYVYSGGRNTNSLMVLDTTTLRSVGVRLTESNIGNIGGVKMSSNGEFIYAAYGDGFHRYASSGTAGDNPRIFVAKISTTDLEVVDRVEVPYNSSMYYFSGPRCLGISGDDSTIAIGVWDIDGPNGQIYVIDASGSEMKVVGDVLEGQEPRVIALNEDGSKIYYGSKTDPSVINVIDVATRGLSTINTKSGSISAPNYLGFGPDGRLYYTRENTSISIFSDLDAAKPSEKQRALTGSACGVDFDKGGDFYYVCEYGQGVSTWDIATDKQKGSVSGGTGWDSHAFAVSPY